MLENRALPDIIDLTVDLPHECDGAVGHKIKNVDCCPCASAIEMSGVRKLMGCRTLHKDCPIW